MRYCDRIVSASSDGSIVVWDAVSGVQIGKTMFSNNVITLAFRNDGKVLATGDYEDGRVLLWDIQSGQILGSPLLGLDDRVEQLAFSPDGRELAGADSNGKIIIWSLNRQSLIERACSLANRNLTVEEWNQYIGGTIPYSATCANYPMGEILPADDPDPLAVTMVPTPSAAPTQPAQACLLDLPDLEITLTKKSKIEGSTSYRFQLEITNWMDYPDELFVPAPDLAPCGSNKNASRTWVNVHDASSGDHIYGSCAWPQMGSSVWFPADEGEYQEVYVSLLDRRCDIEYTSNTIQIP